MSRKRFVMLTGLALVLLWPARWAVGSLPGGMGGVEGGILVWVHLLTELMTAGFCLWAGLAPGRAEGTADFLALGALLYALMNGLAAGVAGNGWYLATSAIQAFGAAAILAGFRGVMDRSASRAWWAGLLIGFIGVGMIGFWGSAVAGGALSGGLLTLENDSYIAFHITAETLAGLTALWGAILLIRRRAGGGPAALVGSGAVLYAALNSLGWGLRTSPVFAVVFAGSAALVAVGAVAVAVGGPPGSVSRR